MLFPYTYFDLPSLVITDSSASWVTDEFVGKIVFFVDGDEQGTSAYGVVSANTDTTITLGGISGSPATTGHIQIYHGYEVQFIPDCSQPSVVAKLYVNSNCFEFNDNDDKRKLSTRVVASGKDLYGKTITVSVSAIHAYNNNDQMFNDSTIVTRRGEGYVYKNTYVEKYKNATVDHTTSPPISIANTDYMFQDGDTVSFTATTDPGGLVAGALYWVKNATYTTMDLAYDAPGGTSVTITSNGSDVVFYKISDVMNPESLGSTYPNVWLYGWDYTLPSGATMALVSKDSVMSVEIAGTAYEFTSENGVNVTRVRINKMPVSTLSNFGNRGFLLAEKLYVQDSDRVGDNEVLIGEEKITITDHGIDATYGHYITLTSPASRITSTTLKCYPHDVGALVARTNYTEASPETDSSFQLYGENIGNYTVDGNITYGQLDQYATYMLLGYGAFYKKATCWMPITLAYVRQIGEYHNGETYSCTRPFEPGDRISVTDFIGATPVEYQIVQVTTDYDVGKVSLELGDFEKNVFTSLEQKTNATNRTLT